MNCELKTRRPNRRSGITLIEMLVVVTIIALFGAIAFQQLGPEVEKGRRVATSTQIDAFMTALQRYNLQNARYPTTEEGLQAIRPFLSKDIPPDPWGNPFVYQFPGEHGSDPDVVSYGGDGQPGGEDGAEDIVSWR